MLLILADSLLFNNFNTYRNGEFEDRFYDKLAVTPWGEKLGVVDANTLHSGNKPDNNAYISPWLKISGHLVVQPNAIMLEANKQALYQFMATHDLLGLDMLNGRITVPTLKALELVGVRYLTFHTSDAYYMPPVEADAPVIRDADGPWIELPGTFPMLFSERVASFDDLAAKDPVLAYRQHFESEDVSHDRAPLHYRKEAGDYLHELVDLTGPSLQQPTANQFILRSPVNEDLSSPGPGLARSIFLLCRRAESRGEFHHQQAWVRTHPVWLVQVGHDSPGRRPGNSLPGCNEHDRSSRG